MLNFCTLFDSNYSVKGLSMYNSLYMHCKDFTLYVVTFDDILYGLLLKMKLSNLVVVKLSDFEDEQLLAVKDQRTRAEYCWTSTPSVILYFIEKYQLDHCTYLDADLYFFSNPKILVEEMGNNDVLITSHRYTPEYDKAKQSGKYCVQFMTFRNTENGINVLKWWRKACLNWCYSYYEDGKFGDQMYLDDWPERFQGVHELTHLGGGVAPWNMQQYEFYYSNGKLKGIEIKTSEKFDLVFFHAHAVLSFKKGVLREIYFQEYSLPPSVKKLIYFPYVNRLKGEYIRIMKLNPTIDGLATRQNEYSWWKYLKVIRRRIINKDNRYIYWIMIK